jgi:hypothetical protein
MISLNTNETLNVQLGTAVTVDVVLTYADLTGTTFSANGSNVSITTTSNTTILSGPAASTQRELKFLSLRNRDVITTSVILKKNVAAVEYFLTAPILLKAGESVHYTDQAGFIFYDWNGRTHRSEPCGAQQAGGVYYPVLFGPYSANSLATGATGFRVIDSGGQTVATYIGRAPKNTKRVLVKYRTCNNSVTATWGELAVATGTPIIGAGTNLTVLGFNGTNNAIANSYTSGVAQLQGTYSNYIDLSPGQILQEGDDTWILIGNLATTGANIRCLGNPDDLQTGLSLAATTRPSLNIGTAIAYSLDAIGNVAPYISVSFT